MRFRIRRKNLLGFAILVLAPAITWTVLQSSVPNARLLFLKELNPEQETLFRVDGVGGDAVLRGSFFWSIPEGKPGKDRLRIGMIGRGETKTTIVPLEDPGGLKVRLPSVVDPLYLSLEWLPRAATGSKTSALVTNLELSWDSRSHSGFSRMKEALSAWAGPGPGHPISFVYTISLVLALLSLLSRATNMSWAQKPYTCVPCWLLISAALVCAFPAHFSPLTRLRLCNVSISTIVLVAVLIGVFWNGLQSRRRRLGSVIFIIIMAGLLRFFLAAETGDKPPKDIDEMVYHGVATNLAVGNGIVLPSTVYKPKDRHYADPVTGSWWNNELYLGMARRGSRTAAVPPGYPVFILFLREVLGHSPIWIYIAQALLAAASCLLVYALGRAMLGPEAGLGALAIMAIHSPAIAATGYMFTETLFAFLILMSAVLLCGRSYARLGLAGLTLGFAFLTRSVALMLAPVWVFYISVMPSTGKRDRLQRSAILLFCFLMVTTPWAVRNKAVAGKLNAGSTFAGKDFFMGNNNTYRKAARTAVVPTWEGLSSVQRAILQAGGAGPTQVKEMFSFPAQITLEGERDHELKLRFFAFAVTHPRVVARLTWQRVLSVLGISERPELWEHFGELPFLFLPALLPLGLLGLGRKGVARRRKAFPAVSALALLLPVVLSVGYPRYRLPADWCLAPLAGMGLFWCMDSLKRLLVRFTGYRGCPE